MRVKDVSGLIALCVVSTTLLAPAAAQAQVDPNIPAITDAVKVTCVTLQTEVNADYATAQRQIQDQLESTVSRQANILKNFWSHVPPASKTALQNALKRARVLRTSSLPDAQKQGLEAQITRELTSNMDSPVRDLRNRLSQTECGGKNFLESIFGGGPSAHDAAYVDSSKKVVLFDLPNEGVTCVNGKTNDRPELVTRLFAEPETLTACSSKYVTEPRTEILRDNFRACSTLDLTTGAVSGTTVKDALRHPTALRAIDNDNHQSHWVTQTQDDYAKGEITRRLPTCTAALWPTPAIPRPETVAEGDGAGDDRQVTPQVQQQPQQQPQPPAPPPPPSAPVGLSSAGANGHRLVVSAQ